MTVQLRLADVWAGSGVGVTPVDDAKYVEGWVSEIPTFQNFNYVLQATTKNLLVRAETDSWEWEDSITYRIGGKCTRSGAIYYSIGDGNTGNDPDLDALGNFWSRAPSFGPLFGLYNRKKGMHLSSVDVSAATVWGGSSQTITAPRPTLQMNTTTGGKNFLLANISNFMCVVDIGLTTEADSRSVAIGQAGVHKIYHQGNKPVQADVTGTIPDAASNGVIYGRQNGNWVAVSATTVDNAPPPPVSGSGTGWYNLDDGVLYIDVDDGDSSQWVPTAPARTVTTYLSNVAYDNSSSGMSAVDVQAAIDELDARIDALHP